VSASAATAASPSWHIVKRVSGGNFGGFTAVAAVGTTGGWAFGGASKPTAWKRSGSTWTKVAFPGKTNESVVAARASSATNVWAFTSNFPGSRALRWNGSSWAVEATFAHPVGGAVILSRDDVWVFGQPGSGLGSWHYDGHAWSRVASGNGLNGGSGLSSSSVWAFGGTSVAHWNGHTWSRTSVKGLLPPKRKPNGINNPAVTAIYAHSRDSVWAIGNGNAEDDGGPLVVLHYNGHKWTRAALSIAYSGYGVLGQVAPDGSGGLWIPMPGSEGGPSHLVHYSGGHLTSAALPVAASKVEIASVAHIAGTDQALAGGITHKAGHPGSDVVSVILRYGS
jgi:hypothetical protein